MTALNLLLRPSLIFDRMVSRFLLPPLLRFDRRIHLEKGVAFRGRPFFHLAGSARLSIGRQAIINSWQSDYHTAMPSPCYFNVRAGASVSIGAHTRFHGSAITAYEDVTIGAKCLVAAGTIIMDCGGHPSGFPRVEERIQPVVDGRPNVGKIAPVVIEDCVFIGANCIIMPGVRIGYGSVVAAGAVVTHDVPPMAVVRGNPAAVVRVFQGADGKDPVPDVSVLSG